MLASFTSAWNKLESSEESQLRKCLHRIWLWASLEGIFFLSL